MKKILSFLGLFAFLSFAINAQYAFKVLAAKGQNKILVANSWADMKAGTKIDSDQKIKVAKDGYLGMIHSSGKTFEIEQGGEFKISSLEAQVIQGKAGFGEKYANFVIDGMFSGNAEAGESYERTGSVNRGPKTPIVIFAPKQISALKNKPVTLEWNACGDGTHKYLISFKNLFNEVIFSDTASTNNYIVDFNNENFSQEDQEDASLKGTFLVEITALNALKYTTNASKIQNTDNVSYSIKLLDEASAKKIEQVINPIEKSMNKKSALDHMVLAMAYEKQGLMVYAVESYSKASSLSDAEAYKNQHEEYIKYKLRWKSLKGSLDE